jgi:hypothetical protein
VNEAAPSVFCPTAHAPQLPLFSGDAGGAGDALVIGEGECPPAAVELEGEAWSLVGAGALDVAGAGALESSAPPSTGSESDETLGPVDDLHQSSDQVLAPRVRQRKAKPRGACCFWQASASAK